MGTNLPAPPLATGIPRLAALEVRLLPALDVGGVPLGSPPPPPCWAAAESPLTVSTNGAPAAAPPLPPCSLLAARSKV